jgi:hypothetical protein
MILDDCLLRTPRQLARIFVHELFHFVWVRLGNAKRREYERLVENELRQKARGELGWSAELAKASVTRLDWMNRTKRWRDYVCESFCDTAGWMYGRAGSYSEMTLAASYRRVRRDWFRKTLVGLPI